MQIIHRCSRTAHTAMRKVYTSLSKINFEIHAQKEKFLLNLNFFYIFKNFKFVCPDFNLNIF